MQVNSKKAFVLLGAAFFFMMLNAYVLKIDTFVTLNEMASGAEGAVFLQALIMFILAISNNVFGGLLEKRQSRQKSKKHKKKRDITDLFLQTSPAQRKSV